MTKIIPRKVVPHPAIECDGCSKLYTPPVYPPLNYCWDCVYKMQKEARKKTFKEATRQILLPQAYAETADIGIAVLLKVLEIRVDSLYREIDCNFQDEYAGMKRPKRATGMPTLPKTSWRVQSRIWPSCAKTSPVRSS